VRDDLKHISDATTKMQQLLEDLLDLSRVGRLANPVEVIAFCDLVNDSLKLAAGRIQERGVAVEVQECDSMVKVDRARMIEVLMNLFDNAVKFMGDQSEPKLTIGHRSDASELVYFVEDNGIGIEPHYQERIFGLFNRLDQTIEGTGIGLTLVKRILEVHGGRIWVESEGKGRGSRLCFTLPQEERKQSHGTEDFVRRTASHTVG
jgi:signal transduction histidine kinase